MNVLKRASARSIAGCYVNPNAHCRVCKAAVYFYANEHGSRVFFDDLGPPWPKHPCTDIPRDYVPKTQSPKRRTRGTALELISAANIAELFKNKVFGRRAADEWTPLVVLDVERRGEQNSVAAEFLDSREGESTTFTCQSASHILEPGDLINMKGDEVSFVHKEALRPVTFKIGGAVVIPQPTKENPPPQNLSERQPHPKERRLVRAVPNKSDYSREPMTEFEMIHFNSDAVSLGDLFAKLEPVVKTYAREHTRKPPDVSDRLNSEGHRTADGALWTPRLVRLLLARMFNDFAGGKPSGTTNGKSPGQKAKPAAPKLPTLSMDNKDEIAKRLSALGRVTMKPRLDD
ncbi:hypothetical protein [Bradyrhizobium sp. SZCCHNRI2014]|uniref:hypothetical protein n=1 Tax=Bradyrhizobium sp. SZCCHNRI2014 TaxID=3057285 RepID=UPI0029162A9F|nr:hypothetical protein [Bradyrhizobium sp. SZCCHNRI2014]